MKQFVLVLSAVLAFVTASANAKAFEEDEKDETKNLEWISSLTTSPDTDEEIGSSTIEFVDSIEDFKAANPGIEPVQMTREIISGSRTAGYRITYRLGSRQGSKKFIF